MKKIIIAFVIGFVLCVCCYSFMYWTIDFSILSSNKRGEMIYCSTIIGMLTAYIYKALLIIK